MKSRIGNTRSGIGSIFSAIGIGVAGSSTPTPPVVSVSAIALSPATGTANSSSGTVIGALSATVANGPLISPVWTLLSSAGGDFQITGGNQVAFLPNNVPAGSYSITAQVAASNLATPFSAPLTVTIGAAQVYVPPTPSVPTGQVTRVDLVSSKSAVAPGAAVPVQVVPNANWAGGNLTLALAKGTGTLSTTTIAAPSSGNATLTFNYTPTAAGEHAITLTGSNLYSPLQHPINCWTPSSGTAGTMTATLNRLDKAPHQYNVFGTKPLGFESMAGYPGYVNPGGWSRVGITVNLTTPTNGLFMKLADAESAGATTTLGTGSYITSVPVQVYGPLTAGSHNINLLLPAGLWMYFAEIATDAAFTNPVRIANRFCCGLVMGINQRSYECAIARNYGDGTLTLSQIGQTFDKTLTSVSFDARYGVGDRPWYQHDGVTPGPDYYFGEGSSAATMRFGELAAHYLGVRVGMTGLSQAGGDIPDHINHDGSPSDGTDGTLANVDREMRWFWLNNAGWNSNDSAYPTQTLDESLGRMVRNVDYVMKNYGVAVVGMGHEGNGYDGDGSAQTGAFTVAGEARMLDLLMASLGAHVRRKTAVGALNGNNSSSHPNQAARTTYAEIGFRAFFAGEVAAFGGLQTNQIGPLLGGAATRTGNVVTVPFTHRGGSTLVSHVSSYDDNRNPARTFGPASGGEIASLFTIYAGANACANSGATVVKIDSATIDNTNNVIVLNLTPGQTLPSVLTLHYNADFGVSNNTLNGSLFRAAWLTDDRTDLSINFQYGWQMPSRIDVPVTGS